MSEPVPPTAESTVPRSAAGPVATPAAQPGNATRQRGLVLILLLVLLGGMAWGAWHWSHARFHVNTDNAYVAGNVVQITPQVGGTVVAIQAEDTDFVRAGQPLVRLDDADARVALEQAQAELAQTVRDVRVLYANNVTLQAQVGAREAELARERTVFSRAQEDVQRRAPLVASGAVGKEEFQHATAQLAGASSAVAAAESALLAAREALRASQNQTDGTSVAQHPRVLRAAARVREAYLALQRVELVAPIDGHVARRGVQIGQRVQAGASLMTVVALDRLWVDANFKESQLQNLRIGQPAGMHADVYGKRVVFRGTVVGLGAGTGAAFALLPAQNATGNWIKVVQRVPVRIALDPQDLAAHPLRVGLSMDVTVDTRERGGKSLADAPRSGPLVASEVFDARQRASDERVARIIADSLGRKSTPAPVERADAR